MADGSQQQLIQECMQSLRRIVKALEDYSLGVEKRFGLTGPQLWALWELGRSGPCALKDLAERMKLDSSTVVGVVDRLVAKGLVVRSPDPGDRRRISLTPTAKGDGSSPRRPIPPRGTSWRALRTWTGRRWSTCTRPWAPWRASWKPRNWRPPSFSPGSEQLQAGLRCRDA